MIDNDLKRLRTSRSGNRNRADLFGVEEKESSRFISGESNCFYYFILSFSHWLVFTLCFTLCFIYKCFYLYQILDSWLSSTKWIDQLIRNNQASKKNDRDIFSIPLLLEKKRVLKSDFYVRSLCIILASICTLGVNLLQECLILNHNISILLYLHFLELYTNVRNF